MRILALVFLSMLYACGSAEPVESFNQEKATEQWKQDVNVQAVFSGDTRYKDEAQTLINSGWFDSSKCPGIGEGPYDTLQGLRDHMNVVITTSGVCDPEDAGLIQVNIKCDEFEVARQILRYIGAQNDCNY